MKMNVALTALGFCLIGAPAHAWINAGSPEGSCCSNSACVSGSNPRGEGASRYNATFGAWACSCGALAQHHGEVGEKLAVCKGGNPLIDKEGNPIKAKKN